MKRLLIVLVTFSLLSCTKNTLTEQPKTLTVQEFESMLTIDKTYRITSMTDTLGNTLPFDTATDEDNRYIFEAVPSDKNGRVYNETTETICFGHWSAYNHPYGWIVFEWVDFDLTPTYYRIMDYNIENGYFIARTGSVDIRYELTYEL